MKKQICEEDFSKLPFTSEHIFKCVDNHFPPNPLYCEKCGKSYKEWSDKCLENSKLIEDLVVERLKQLPDGVRICIG